jgi:hypothetical protein
MSNCYANPSPIFQPAMRLITAITQANPAQITTSFAHNYKNGMIVRIDVPPADGMQQIDGMTGTIMVTGPTTFIIDIDTTSFDVFSIPVTNENTCAQVVPIGEVNETLLAATVNVLPSGDF